MDKVDPLANSKAHPHTFSAIISDIMLGKMDGAKSGGCGRRLIHCI